MKKLFFILFSAISFAQSPEIYGSWVNQEGEYVRINYNNTFDRFKIEPKTKEKIILSKGIIKMDEKELHIIRKDTIDGYKLCYYIGNETMVICKPRSEKAWLWQKTSN